MKDEMEEGHFDKAGTYIHDKKSVNNFISLKVIKLKIMHYMDIEF